MTSWLLDFERKQQLGIKATSCAEREIWVLILVLPYRHLSNVARRQGDLSLGVLAALADDSKVVAVQLQGVLFNLV